VECEAAFQGGNSVLRNPLAIRLATQLVPAALVTAVGIVALSNLARAPETAPATLPVPAAITAEAVFTATPREPLAEPAKAVQPRPAATAKTAAATPLPPRKPALETAPKLAAITPAPLPVVQVPEQAKTAEAEPARENWMVGTLRTTTAAVQAAPQWALRSMAGWFQDALPPRPPASVPAQNFQAAM
jgi:hypothetical protein